MSTTKIILSTKKFFFLVLKKSTHYRAFKPIEYDEYDKNI